MRARTWALAVLTALVAAACAGPEEDVGEAADAELVESAPVAAALSDPEIAHVAVTANAIDSSLAHLALERAESDEVRDFAQRMINDHGAVNRQAVELAGRLGVTPAANGVSEELQRGASAASAELGALSGAAFDRAYMDREVAYHQAVLDALDGMLIPGAANAELRGLLEQVRPAIEAHLALARELQRKLTS